MEKTRFLQIGVYVLLAVAAAVEGTESSSGSLSWERMPAPGGLDRAAALALDPAGPRLAAGGERGVAWGPRKGPLERVLLRTAVRELCFARGALWAASDSGLWRIDTTGARAESLAPGERARSVRDLAAAGDRLLAATDAGVFESVSPGRWRRLSALPQRPAARVEVVGQAEGSEVWALFEGELWRLDATARAERVRTPTAASGEEGALDLALDARGRPMVLRARSLSLRDETGVWQSQALVLPPGSAPGRLVAALGKLWLGTDAGLLSADGIEGPWRRAAAPLGHDPVSALAGDAEGVVVATSQGLFRTGGASRSLRAAASAGGAAAASSDPPVQAVHRAAMRHLELEPRRMHALARAVGRAAWLPELRVGIDHDQGRDRRSDFDEAFVSGETRFLHDRDRSRFRDFGASVELSWDLGETVFDADRIAVSREARLVAQLRDDVLDEINQLYFERQRVLASLAAPPPDTSAAMLGLRAAELAAGIDAWTGGWFSAELSRPQHPAR